MKKHSLLTQIKEFFPTFEEENCAIARKALQMLRVSEASIEKGLNARPACRLEVVNKNPLIIVDVGHNPDGLQHLFKAIKQKFPHQEIHVLFGLSKSKDITGCLTVLKKYGTQFTIVEAKNGRGLEIEEVYKKMLALNFPVSSITKENSITKAVHQAVFDIEKHYRMLVICGTFFIMGEARKALGFQDPMDDFDMNER